MAYSNVLAAALAPAAQGVGQAVGNFFNPAASAQSGNFAAQGLGAQGLVSGMVLDPNQQLAIQQQAANQAAANQLQIQQQGAAFQAGLGNQLANLSNQRQQALNAQQNAAMNVANQLGNLSQARATNAQAITNAMNSVGQFIR